MDEDDWNDLFAVLRQQRPEVTEELAAEWYRSWGMHVDASPLSRAVADFAHPGIDPTLYMLRGYYTSYTAADRQAEAELAALRPPDTSPRSKPSTFVDALVEGSVLPPDGMTVDAVLVWLAGHGASHTDSPAKQRAIAALALRGLRPDGTPLDAPSTLTEPKEDAAHAARQAEARQPEPAPARGPDRHPQAAPSEPPAWRRTRRQGES